MVDLGGVKLPLHGVVNAEVKMLYYFYGVTALIETLTSDYNLLGTDWNSYRDRSMRA